MPKHPVTKLSEDQEATLILLIEQKPEIWNKTEKAHKNVYRVSKLWDEIEATLNIDSEYSQ